MSPVRAFACDLPPSRVRFGRGDATEHVVAELAILDAARVLIVAGQRHAELAARLTGPSSERVVDVFTEVEPHVPERVARAARERAVHCRADSLLSVGGGSATGTAKAVALTEGLPIVAVPTTYAGSEMTPVWGITSEGQKVTGHADHVRPRVVVYDPELVQGLPGTLAVASALNALAHSVESLWAPGTNPVVALLALEGARVLGEGLRALDEGRSDAPDRLLYGCFLAGASFAVAGSGLHHKICHALGGTFGLPHAETHAVVLPHVLAFNAPALPDVMAPLGSALGVVDPIAGLLTVRDRASMPTSLSELGLGSHDLERAVEATAALLPIANPRPVDEKDLRAILAGAMTGSVG
ncbi:maleylacetate reductase [Nocardioides hungaricus]